MLKYNSCNLVSSCYFFLFSGLVPEMATSPEVFKSSAVKGMSKYPALPPIEGVQQQQQQGEVERAAAAKEDQIPLTVHKRLLRHRRSKVQQEQLHRILYVVFICSVYANSFVRKFNDSHISLPSAVFLLAPTLECLNFTVHNDVCAELDTRRLFSHSCTESGKFSLLSLKIQFAFEHDL